MATDQLDRTAKIAALNDAFRTSGSGHTVITQGVRALPLGIVLRVMAAVLHFDKFPADCPEHDFGLVNVANTKFFFKIDYYDADSFDTGSDDPADPAKTHRVMTIMRADEY
jgi:hypothetical protein